MKGLDGEKVIRDIKSWRMPMQGLVGEHACDVYHGEIHHIKHR